MRHPGKSATEASIRMIAWRPGITQDVQHFVSICENCQMKRPSLGKTVYMARSRSLGTAPHGLGLC